MTDWRKLLHSKRAKYIVLALAVADGAGFYLVNNRLNQPWAVPAGGAADSAVALDNSMPVISREELNSPPTFAINDLPAIVPTAATVDSSPVPALVPEVLAVAKELPTYVPGVHLSSRKVLGNAAPTARLERSRRAAGSQFSNVFAAETQYPVTQMVGPPVEFGPARTNALEAPQYGAGSDAVDVYAPAAAQDAPAVQVDVYGDEISSVNEADTAPESALPVQELPASEPSGELPAG